MFIVIKFAEDLMICNHRDKCEHAQLFFYNNDQARLRPSNPPVLAHLLTKDKPIPLILQIPPPLFAICNDNNTVSKAGSVASNKGY